MKICPSCGAALNDDSIFCKECGSKVGDVQMGGMPMDNGAMNGMPMDNGAMNGMPMDNGVMNNNPQMNGGFNNYGNAPMGFGGEPYPQKKKSKAPLIIGICAGVVVLIVAVLVGILLVGSKKDGGSDSATGVAKSYINAVMKDFDGKKAMKYIAYDSDHKEEVEDECSSLDELKSFAGSLDITVGKAKEVKLSKSDIEDFWDEYEYDVYVDKEDVKNLTSVKCSVKMSFMGQSQTEDVITYVGKYKGKWKVIYSDS